MGLLENLINRNLDREERGSPGLGAFGQTFLPAMQNLIQRRGANQDFRSQTRFKQGMDLESEIALAKYKQEMEMQQINQMLSNEQGGQMGQMGAGRVEGGGRPPSAANPPSGKKKTNASDTGNAEIKLLDAELQNIVKNIEAYSKLPSTNKFAQNRLKDLMDAKTTKERRKNSIRDRLEKREFQNEQYLQERMDKASDSGVPDYDQFPPNTPIDQKISMVNQKINDFKKQENQDKKFKPLGIEETQILEKAKQGMPALDKMIEGLGPNGKFGAVNQAVSSAEAWYNPATAAKLLSPDAQELDSLKAQVKFFIVSLIGGKALTPAEMKLLTDLYPKAIQRDRIDVANLQTLRYFVQGLVERIGSKAGPESGTNDFRNLNPQNVVSDTQDPSSLSDEELDRQILAAGGNI